MEAKQWWIWRDHAACLRYTRFVLSFFCLPVRSIAGPFSGRVLIFRAHGVTALRVLWTRKKRDFTNGAEQYRAQYRKKRIGLVCVRATAPARQSDPLKGSREKRTQTRFLYFNFPWLMLLLELPYECHFPECSCPDIHLFDSILHVRTLSQICCVFPLFRMACKLMRDAFSWILLACCFTRDYGIEEFFIIAISTRLKSTGSCKFLRDFPLSCWWVLNWIERETIRLFDISFPNVSPIIFVWLWIWIGLVQESRVSNGSFPALDTKKNKSFLINLNNIQIMNNSDKLGR